MNPPLCTERFPPPFFIVGSPRSGTTLVSRILDSHSRMAVYHESHYYTLFRSDLHRYGDLTRLTNLNRLIGDVREAVRIQGFIEPPEVEEFLSELVTPTFEGVLSALLRFNARRQGKTRGGDKTPNHHAYLDEILERFPESPVIFVMRDPRDSALAMKEKFAASLDSATRLWNLAFRSYQRASGKVRLVRYENLIEKPLETTRILCDDLGERYEERMLRFFDRVPARLAANPHYKDLLGPVNPGLAGRFRDMPRQDIERIESACAAGMEALGYPFTGAKPVARTARSPSRFYFLLERLRYYGRDRDRWRRGWIRWKIMFRLRARYFLSFGWLR